MDVVSVEDAEADLEGLLERVLAGEDIVISRAGRPIARLVPALWKWPRTPGRLKGAITVAPNFDEQLIDEL